jgi:DNA repair protein SbcC/Rad50
MRLLNLNIERLPGIKAAFSITAGKGVNLILGPNESGKSSLVRTVSHFFWPNPRAVKPTVAQGRFLFDDKTLHAESYNDSTVTWKENGEIISGPSVPVDVTRSAYNISVLDLMRPGSNEVDHDLAQEIRLRMAGGYDLEALGNLIPDPQGKFTKKQKAWLQDRQKTGEIVRTQKALADDQGRLQELHIESDRATTAKERMRLLQVSIHLMEARQALVNLNGQSNGFPAGMKNFIANDPESLTDSRNRIKELEQQQKEQKEILDQKSKELVSLDLPVESDKCNAGLIAEILRECRPLKVTQRELAREYAGAEARLALEKINIDPRVLGPEAELPTKPQELFHKLTRLYQETMVLDAAYHERKNLASEKPLPNFLQESEEGHLKDRQAFEQINLGLDEHTRRGGFSPPGVNTLLWGAISFAAGVAGCVLLFWDSQSESFHPLISGAAALSVVSGGALILHWWQKRHQFFSHRQTLESTCSDSGHPLPAAWTEKQARALVLNLERTLCESQTVSRARKDLQSSQDEALARTEEDLKQAEEQRQQLLDKHNLPLGLEAADLLAGIGTMIRYQAALGEVGNQQGKLQECSRQVAEAENKARLEFAAGNIQVPADIDALTEALSQLEKKRQQRDHLRQSQSEGKTQLDSILSHRNHQQELILSLLDRLELKGDPQPEVAVAKLEQTHKKYLAVQSSMESTGHECKRLARELSEGSVHLEAGEWENKTIPEIALMLEGERALASTADDLIYKIATIDNKIQTTRRNRELADARAAENDSHQGLVDIFEERNHAALAQVLAQSTQTDFEENSRPKVLVEASRLFGIFSRFGYQLRVTAGGEKNSRQVFQAVPTDRSQLALDLEELSTGTRAQLLLASRLAFIKESETGVQVPIFLDESLTSSDPDRFAAIAGSLAKWAHESSRQIFYLTSNPADVAAWQLVLKQEELDPPHFIDLGAIRLGAKAADPSTFQIPSGTIEPPPGELSAAEYGSLLQIPKLDPWAGENAASLFYLLRDDLDLLHRLRQAGISSLGRWRVQPDQILHCGIITEKQQMKLEARGQILGAFLESWQQGRGCVLDAITLKDSGILSDKMIGPVQQLLAEKKGDARSFMDSVYAGKVKRLHSNKKEELQNFLERNGFIDSRPLLESQLVINHIVQAMSRELEGGIVNLTSINLLVAELEKAINGQ